MLDDPIAHALQTHVRALSEKIGERNFSYPDNLERAAAYIHSQFQGMRYVVHEQWYTAHTRTTRNLLVSKRGEKTPEEIIVLGAHYDTVEGSPGADDNASGVAVLLELARLTALQDFSKTLHFVAFSTEEPPFFKTHVMGSRVYTRQAKKNGERIVGMISLEMVGYYLDQKGSQSYPPGFGFFYPSSGNYIALVSDFRSRPWKNQMEEALTRHMSLPVESVATFRFIPGIDWSDHWSFWKEGYPALMVTDTAFYRYPHYHRETDTSEKLDYARMAELTRGLLGALAHVAR